MDTFIDVLRAIFSAESSARISTFLASPFVEVVLWGSVLYVFVSGALVARGRSPLFAYIIRFLRWMWFRTTSKNVRVLYFADFDEQGHYKASFKTAFEREFPNARIRFHFIRSGDDLTYWPLSVRVFAGVLLVVTDVTQLASDPKKRSWLQDRMQRFVERGGVLIATHDALYRRAKNHHLQGLFGGQITRFQQTSTNPVVYRRNESLPDHLVARGFADLPPTFSLHDGEILGGTWQADVHIVYAAADREDEFKEAPLVTARSVGEGMTFWLNSGDTSASGPPKSVILPQREFLGLIAACLGVHRASGEGKAA